MWNILCTMWAIGFSLTGIILILLGICYVVTMRRKKHLYKYNRDYEYMALDIDIYRMMPKERDKSRDTLTFNESTNSVIVRMTRREYEFEAIKSAVLKDIIRHNTPLDIRDSDEMVIVADIPSITPVLDFTTSGFFTSKYSNYAQYNSSGGGGGAGCATFALMDLISKSSYYKYPYEMTANTETIEEEKVFFNLRCPLVVCTSAYFEYLMKTGSISSAIYYVVDPESKDYDKIYRLYRNGEKLEILYSVFQQNILDRNMGCNRFSFPDVIEAKRESNYKLPLFNLFIRRGKY